MKLFGSREFAVLQAVPEGFRGVLFRRHGQQWEVISSAESAGSPPDFPKLLARLGCGRDTGLYLTGALPGGVFFTMRSAELSARDQRGAVEMELPRQLPHLPDDIQYQCLPGAPDGSGMVPVDVYTFSDTTLRAAAEPGAGRIDEFLFPLLGAGNCSEPLFLPEIESDFYWCAGAWHPVSGAEAEIERGTAFHRRRLQEIFRLPEGLSFEKYFVVLMAARLVADGSAARESVALRAIPEEARPARFRNQLRITVVLGGLLAASVLWGAVRNWHGEYREYREVKQQLDACRNRISTIRSKLRRNTRTRKEIARIIGLRAGEPDILGKLAAFSKVLPDNILVSRLRWSDSGIDLMMQSENTTVNFPVALRSLHYWKVAQLRQRQRWNSDITTITLRLVPNTAGTKGRRR